MCAVRLRVGCKKLGFLVFMRPVFNSFETIYFFLQCLPSFIITEYVYELRHGEASLDLSNLYTNTPVAFR